MTRHLRVTAALFMLSGLVSAQWGTQATPQPTSASQSQAINQAMNFLGSTTSFNLSGVNVQNADIAGNVPGISNETGTEVGVDFDRLDEVIPPGTPGGSPHYPGVVAIIIFHELQHSQGGWGDADPCTELELTVFVADYHCDLIAFVAAGGGAVNALCAVYDHVKDMINSSEMQEEAAENGCSGDTGPVPDCPQCP